MGMIERTLTNSQTGTRARADFNPPTQEPGPGPLAGTGGLLLVLFLFLSYSRLTDTFLTTGSIVFTISIVALCISIATGGVQRAVFCRIGFWLCAFSFWLVLAVPFSFWRGGSVEVLRESWLKSFLAFLIVAGLPRTVNHCRLAAYGIGAATATIIVRALLFGVNETGRLVIVQGVLSNPNTLAQFTLMGLPLLWFTLLPRPASMLRRVAAGVFIVGGMLVVARTSSRGGLVAIGCLVVLLGLSLTFLNKIKLIVGAAVIVVIVMGSLSADQRARYMTMFGGDAGEAGQVEQSAILSRQERLELLKQSLIATAKHPVFGVGPGVFEAYLDDVAVREGRRTNWQVTHNSYTQVSSEAGIPALIFWVGALLACLKATRQIYKADGYGDPSVGRMAYAMFLTLIAFGVTAFFDSVVYQMYFPTLAGLTVALVHGVSLQRATAADLPRSTPVVDQTYRVREMARKPPVPA